MDGNAVAVAGYDCSGDYHFTTVSTYNFIPPYNVISIYNLISGTRVYSHRLPRRQTVVQIWTHGESLRFATVEPGSITIWEVGFTSEHTLAEIESLPAPDDVGSEILFLPTLSRLAFILRGAVLIWDARDSKFLLNFVGGGQLGGLSFSSDGRFLACGITSQEVNYWEFHGRVHLWKESPTGYVLHQELVSGPTAKRITPFLSPDGESIIMSKDYETQLWRTTDQINPHSSFPPQPAEQTDFVLAFSPDKSFIATGRLGESIATIFDLKSGDPRLIVDTDMKICGLGVTASTAIVVGEGKIITWNLPAGDCVLNATAKIHDSVRTIVFNHPPPPSGRLHSASISPDFNYLVITKGKGDGLDIYDMPTGKHVVGNATEYVLQPWFTRDGREVRYLCGGLKIIRGRGSDIIGLELIENGDYTPEEYLWKSCYGHSLVDDCWILDSSKKRVMWLPHNLRSLGGDWTWDERFLVLFDPELPEPVIIELYE